jgi:hypothetical protein
MLKAENSDRKPKKQVKQKTRSPKKTPTKKAPTKKTKTKTTSKRKEKLKELLSHVNETDGLKRTIGSLQEQVGSYVLLGYSFNGAPITAVAAATPQEYDALYQRVQTFLQQRPPAILYQPLDSPPPEE